MAMVQPKSQKARLFITHLLLLLFIAAIMFPSLSGNKNGFSPEKPKRQRPVIAERCLTHYFSIG